MKRHCVFAVLLAALACAGSARLSAQDAVRGDWQRFLDSDGVTVYDSVNNVVWLADANLPARTLSGNVDFRFGLPLCDLSSTDPTEPPDPCVNLSGSMTYTSAVAWIAAMNSANYLGHSDWQMPTAPPKDHDCSATGPSGDSFAFGCDTGALGYLYYTALGLKAPNTAVPIPPNTVGPFRNFQPNLYWSDTPAGGLACNTANFSFASGAHGAGCGGDFADVLPMIKGETLGMPIPTGSELYVNPGGKTVYDPETNVTWLADANLAATAHHMLGLPRCKTAPETAPCVARDGSMNYESAVQFIANMNAFGDGKGYLGQTNWELPSLDASCPTYGCGGDRNPMGNLYYDQLNILAGTPVVKVPDITVGPFHDLQPFPYWSCLANTIQEFCESEAHEPAASSEWGFSFGTGFQGSAHLTSDHFVTAYYVVTTATKPPIPPKCPPSDPSCYQ